MPANDDTLLFDRALGSYEKGRFRWAASQAFLLAFFPLLAWSFGAHPEHCLVIGLVLLGSGVGALVLGRGVGRAVLMGALGGTPALVLSLAAQAYGHVCMDDGCYSLCMPACALGGVVAGFVAFRASKLEGGGTPALLSSGTFSLLTGALGCSCVGYTGVAALAVALAATAATARLLVPARA